MLQAHLTFHGVSYKVVTAVHGDRLCIEVEQADDASRWRGDFSAHCECSIAVLVLQHQALWLP